MLKTWNETETHSFFATTPPGLEGLALEQIEALSDLGIKEARASHGGVDFVAPIKHMPEIIRSLKIPTHLLWRLGSFRVRDFPKLYTKVKGMTWAHFIVSEEIKMKVSATNSRLIHTGRIEKTLRDAIKTSLAARGPKKELIKRFEALESSHHPTLYARLDNDSLTLSLDLAGENLHRRSGNRKWIGAAPLRENLAYACLMVVKNELQERGYNSNELTMWDPFCGSATFVNESLSWNKLSAGRTYALDIYDSFEKTAVVSVSKEDSLFAHHYGSDLDQKIVQAAKKNLEVYSTDLYQIENQAVKVATAPKEKFVIVTNPPYGERIQSTEGLSDLYERRAEFEDCLGVFVLVPHHLAPKEASLLIKFSHGGISVGLYFL